MAKQAELDFENMDPGELAALIAKAQAAHSKANEKRREELKKTTEELAAKLGLGVKFWVLGEEPAPAAPKAPKAAPKASSGSTVAAKYRHGNDTWSGRGRAPKWLQALEAQGHSRDEYLIKS